MPDQWTVEDDRKLFINIITQINPTFQGIDYPALAQCFEGRTTRSIQERIKKIRHGVKTMTAPASLEDGYVPPAPQARAPRGSKKGKMAGAVVKMEGSDGKGGKSGRSGTGKRKRAESAVDESAGGEGAEEEDGEGEADGKRVKVENEDDFV